jgi:hypothetical protein
MHRYLSQQGLKRGTLGAELGTLQRLVRSFSVLRVVRTAWSRSFGLFGTSVRKERFASDKKDAAAVLLTGEALNGYITAVEATTRRAPRGRRAPARPIPAGRHAAGEQPAGGMHLRSL